MLKGKHSHVLNGITIDHDRTGKAVAWCAAPTDADGTALYLPPIDQLVHVPFNSKKPVQGLFITPTVKFLTMKLAGKAEAERAVVVEEADQAEQEAKHVQQEEASGSQGPPRKRRRDYTVYEPVVLDGSLFPDGKYRGKYSDPFEGDL